MRLTIFFKSLYYYIHLTSIHTNYQIFNLITRISSQNYFNQERYFSRLCIAISKFDFRLPIFEMFFSRCYFLKIFSIFGILQKLEFLAPKMTNSGLVIGNSKNFGPSILNCGWIFGERMDPSILNRG